jgi:hypothetical protein
MREATDRSAAVDPHPENETDSARPETAAEPRAACGQRVGLVTRAAARQINRARLTSLFPLPTVLALDPALPAEIFFLDLFEDEDRLPR